jgi:exosortase
MSSNEAAAETTPVPTAVPRGIPWRAFIWTAVVAAACAPWLLLHLQRLWSKPHYQFFPIVFLGATVLAVRGWKGLGQLKPGTPGYAHMVLALGWLFLLGAGFFGAGFFRSGLLGTVALFFIVVAGIYAAGGRKLLSGLLPAWAFLWLIIPLPGDLDTQLILQMQTWTAAATSRVLDLFRIIHVMAGNVIEVKDKRLMVEEACSGIHSLYAVLTCAFFYVLWTRAAPVRGALLLVAAVVWVLLANVTRVVVIVWAFTRWGIDLSQDIPHEVLGWTLFAVTLLLVWSTDRLLLFFSLANPLRTPELGEDQAPAPKAAQGESPPTPTRLPTDWSRRLGSWPALAGFTLLATLQLALFSYDPPAPRSTDELVKTLARTTIETLPPKIDTWQQFRFDTSTSKALETIQGVRSRSWYFQSQSGTAGLSLDFPFHDWHDLLICYRAQGWQVNERKIQPDDGKGEGAFIRALLEKPLDRHGYLWFGLMDSTGQFLPPPEEGIVAGLVAARPGGYPALWHRLTGRAVVTVPDLRPTCQVQLVIESYLPLGKADLEKAQALFLEARRLLRKRLLTD